MVVHGDKLRWLFWLRWKILIRSFTRSAGRTSRIIGTIFLVLFGLPFVGGIAVGTYFAYRILPPPANAEVLFLVLTAVYIIWIVLPLFEFTVNEGLDLSKLALFPLTRAELMMSLLFSSLLDIPTLGLLLVFAAVVAGWAFSLPLALMALLTMIIFYTQVIGASQLVLALLMRTLQSRRFRDLSIILIALFASSCYLLQQLVLWALRSTNVAESLANATFSAYLQWLPPGMAARAIQQAYAGNWAMSFAWLGALVIISVIVLYLWQLVIERGLSAPESGGSSSSQRRRGAQEAMITTPATSANFLQRLIPTQVWAIIIKDLKYFRRDPQWQAMLAQSLVSMLVLVVVTIINTRGTGSSGGALREEPLIGSWVVMFAPLYVLFFVYTFSYNVLGFERQSLMTLFLLPVEPKRILWGKNLLTSVLGIIAILVMVLGIAIMANSWEFVVPSLAIALAGLGVTLGFGNFTSVFLPQRIRQMRRGIQSSANLTAEGGCLRAVYSMIAFAALLVILLPVAAALLLPVFFNVRWIWTISIPLSLLYGAVFYHLVTINVAPRMLRRTPEILEIVARE